MGLTAATGLFSFPAKTMQHNFLSTFKPTFYIRQRDYSKVHMIEPWHIEQWHLEAMQPQTLA